MADKRKRLVLSCTILAPYVVFAASVLLICWAGIILPLAHLEAQPVGYEHLVETTSVQFWESSVSLYELDSSCSSRIAWGMNPEVEITLRSWQVAGWAVAIAYLLVWFVFIGIRAREIVQLTKYVQLSNALIIGVAIGCPCLILFLALVGPSISCPLYHQVVVRNANPAKSTVVIAAVGLCLGLVATLFPRVKRRGKVV